MKKKEMALKNKDIHAPLIEFSEASNQLNDAFESLEKKFVGAFSTRYHCPSCNTKLMIHNLEEDYMVLFCTKCGKKVKGAYYR